MVCREIQTEPAVLALGKAGILVVIDMVSGLSFEVFFTKDGFEGF